MMGLAIAHEARGQVSFDQDTTYVNPTYQFSFEKEEEHYDYGEEISVI